MVDCMRVMRSLLSLAACIGFISLPLRSAAPQAPQETAAKFAARTELVLVPVLVRRGGQHVAGLKQEDFILQQDGKPATIAVFEEVHAAPPTARPTATAQEFTNVKPQQAEQLTIIALDLVNTAPLDQAYLRQEVLKFLDTAAQTGEPFSLVAITTSGIRVLQDFTSDPKLIAAAVRKQPGKPVGQERAGSTGNPILDQTPCAASAVGCGGGKGLEQADREIQAWFQFRTNQEPADIFRDRNARLDTLAALQQLAQSVSGLPGRKSVIWASSGIQFLGGIARVAGGFGSQSPRNDYSTFNTQRVVQSMDENVRALQLLSAANVAVYPLDARHGANTSFAMYDVNRSDAPIGDSGFGGDKGRVQNQDQETVTMFQQVAAATGGKPCFNRTDLANCLKEDAADSHDYYMLGFYADKDVKPGWHAISVKLNKQSADLRHRSGYLAVPLDPAKARLTDLQLAMVSPLPYTALPITGRFTNVETQQDKRVASFALDLAPQAITIGEADNRLNFDVVAVVRGADGKEAAKLAQRIDRKLLPEQVGVIREQGIHYTNKLVLPPGSYGVWFVVRDNNTGRTGSAMTTLTVQ